MEEVKKSRVYLHHPKLEPYVHEQVTESDKREFLKKLEVTDEDIVEIEHAPQRSKKWEESKEKRIGSSTAGQAVGNNPYKDGASQKDLLGTMLWTELKKPTNAAMFRGIFKEKFITDMLEVYYTCQS